MKICQSNAKEMVKGLRGALELGWVCWERVQDASHSQAQAGPPLTHPLLGGGERSGVGDPPGPLRSPSGLTCALLTGPASALSLVDSG